MSASRPAREIASGHHHPEHPERHCHPPALRIGQGGLKQPV
jgi:hypothetical protein